MYKKVKIFVQGLVIGYFRSANVYNISGVIKPRSILGKNLVGVRIDKLPAENFLRRLGRITEEHYSVDLEFKGYPSEWFIDIIKNDTYSRLRFILLFKDEDEGINYQYPNLIVTSAKLNENHDGYTITMQN